MVLTFKPSISICLGSIDANGSWSQTSNGLTTTITLNDDNSFDGADSVGCVYAGTLTDAQVEGDVMDISAWVSNCAKEGDYSGVGSLVGDNADTTVLLGALWSDSRVIVFNLERLVNLAMDRRFCTPSWARPPLAVVKQGQEGA